MPNLHEGWTSTGSKHRRVPGVRARRVVLILMTLFSLLVLFAGIASLAQGLEQKQRADRLAAAPACGPGQQTGCKSDERVTVVNFNSEEAGRSGYISQDVEVRTPDGSTQTVFSHDQDFGLWSRLQVNEYLNAELLDGNIVRLYDSAGHYLLAGDEPTGSYFTGVLFTALGGLMLGFFARVLWRDGRHWRPH